MDWIQAAGTAILRVRPMKVDVFNAYLPWDRACAIARGESLPTRTEGAALFVDISGFTPLTEALARILGPRRGVEELTHHLNLVYDTLVTEVHRFGGSVIGFAGDAITCWFDKDTGSQAIAAALSMQQGMGKFSRVEVGDGTGVGLAVKASVATGPVRRFLVGDEEIQLLDLIAGDTLGKMETGGRLARRGEVVVDRETAIRLEACLRVAEWREDPASGARFGLVGNLDTLPAECPRRVPPPLTEAQLRPWLLDPVYRRLASGQGEFLTELRSAVPIFLRFSGLDYDGDESAGDKLDAFVRWVQRLISNFGGFLIDVTVGDKGSYLYCGFGAPIAHENDLWRALTVATQLRRPPAEFDFISNVQIGISRGIMRTGAYGGTERRTYGVLGSEVNMAARLMEKAEPWQVLAAGKLRNATETHFTWEDHPPLHLKGKAEPFPVAVLLDPIHSNTIRSTRTPDGLPFVGRERELREIGDRLGRAAGNHGQTILLVAEAGMGKSRLAAEAVALARQQDFTVFQGECVSHGEQTSYLAWWSVWSDFFKITAEQSPRDRIAALEQQLASVDPALVVRLPLLGPVLNLEIPDNSVTSRFDAKLRKSSLEALLVDCVRHRATTRRMVFLLEDTHWIDPLSRDLLEVIGRAMVRLPVLLVVTRRPSGSMDPDSLPSKAPGNSLVVRLDQLAPTEAEQLLKHRIPGIFGTDVRPSRELLSLLVTRSEGNPFYLEELLNFLKDQGMDPGDPNAVASLELPTSLHNLVISRIDQLTESQRTTLKLASVVGRVFRLRTLLGVNPLLERHAVEADLQELGRLELTPLERPGTDPAYAFKHVVTQEVAYESLPFAMRAKLHNDIGLQLENGGETGADRLDLLAFHFDRSSNEPKKRDYLLKAGNSAQSRYANAAAIEYYRKVLPLVPADAKVPVLIQLGQVLELVGKWSEAGEIYGQALDAAMALGDSRAEARCRSARGELRRKEGEYVEALRWLEEARHLHERVGDEAGLAEVLHVSGTVNAQRGEFERAKELYDQSMVMRQKLGDKPKIASLLSNLGIIAWFRNDLGTARSFYEESLTIRREIGDRWSIANSLNNLALLLSDLGEIRGARGLLEESLAINRELGDRWAISNALSSLGDVALDEGDSASAREFLKDGMAISCELGDRGSISFLLEQFAELAVTEGDATLAHQLAGAASALREAIQYPGPPNQQQRLQKWLEKLSGQLSETERNTATLQGRRMGMDRAVGLALNDTELGNAAA